MKTTPSFPLLLSIILYSLVIQAQPIVHYPSVVRNKAPQPSGGVTARGANGEKIFSLSVSTADDSTTYYYPLNKITRQVNFAYFINTRYIDVSIYIPQHVNVKDIRFRAFEKDSAGTSNWQQVTGRMVRQNERDGSYQTNIFMAPITCNNKVLHLQAYHINDPESLVTQIVSTKAIARPFIAALYHVYKTVKNDRQSDSSAYILRPLVPKVLKDINLNNEEIYSGQLLLTTDNEPALYHAYVIRNYQGNDDSILLNQQWMKINRNEVKTNSLMGRQLADTRSAIYTIPIPKEYLNRPGKYRLAVIPGFLQPGSSTKFTHSFPEQGTTLSYSVQRTKSWLDWLMIVLSIIGMLAIPFTAFILYRNSKQKKRLQQQEQLTKENRLKLDLVRAQLNPHFVYNALSGIQNLLQKNQILEADKYLAKFSRLSRKILNNSEQELISLEDEIQMLDDYLQMEQMRFGFNYSFQTNSNIDIINTEIPAMLIQPFVENAVKHGVSSVPNGHITIQFEKSGQNILINIRDNGKGYAPGNSTGNGSVLSQNRIELLNNINKTIPIKLSVHSDKEGTLIQITLNDWLA